MAIVRYSNYEQSKKLNTVKNGKISYLYFDEHKSDRK